MKHWFVGACTFGLLVAGPLAAQKLAEKLPADTLIYLELPNVPAIAGGLEGSAMGRIYHDPQVQDFLGGLLPMMQQGLAQAKAMAMGMGAPAEMLDWGAILSLEAGFSMRVPPGGFEENPQIMAGVQLSLRDADLAERAFQWLAGMAAAHGGGEPVDVPTGRALRLAYEDDERLEVRLEGDSLVLWAQLGDWEATGSLAGGGDFKSMRGRLLDQSGAVFAFVNMPECERLIRDMVKHIPDSTATQILSGVLDKTGMSLMGSMAMASGWKEGHSYTTGAVDYKPGGWDFHKPVQAADLSLLDYIPDSATSFSVSGNADFAGAWEILHDAGRQFLDYATTSGKIDLPADHPVRAWFSGEKSELVTKGMQALGPRSFSFAVVNPSNPMGSSGVGGSFVEVRDVQAVRGMFSEFIPQLGAMMAAIPELPLELKSKRVPIRQKDEAGNWTTVDGPEYHTLSIRFAKLPGEMRQMGMFLGQFQPTFGVSDDGWLVFDVSPTSVRSALSKGVKKPESNIRANPDVGGFLGRLPKEVWSLSWSDPRPSVSGMVTMAGGMLPMVAANLPKDQIPVNFDKFPGPEAFTAHLQPSESYSYNQGSSTMFHSTGSFQVADLTVMGAGAMAGAALFFGVTRMDRQEAAEAEVVIEETVVPPAGAELSATLEELGRLQTGVLVYELENGAYPASLAALLQTSASYPKGYLPQPERGVQADGWGKPIQYKLKADGGFLLYSCGPNGIDEGGQGDDVSLD